MGKAKREKGRQKRLDVLDKKLEAVIETEASQRGLTLKPNLASVLVPPKQPSNEVEMEVQIPCMVALLCLEHARGTRLGIESILGRLHFGRTLAHMFFTDDNAEEIHHGFRTLLNAAIDQYDTDRMNLLPEEAEPIQTALNMVILCTRAVNPVEYHKAIFRFIQEPIPNYLETNALEWEDFKVAVGWTE